MSFDLVVGYREDPRPRMVRLVIGLCAPVAYCCLWSLGSFFFNAPAMPTKHRCATARQLLVSDHISHPRLSLRAGSPRIQEGLLRRSPKSSAGMRFPFSSTSLAGNTIACNSGKSRAAALCLSKFPCLGSSDAIDPMLRRRSKGSMRALCFPEVQEFAG